MLLSELLCFTKSSMLVVTPLSELDDYESQSFRSLLR